MEMFKHWSKRCAMAALGTVMGLATVAPAGTILETWESRSGDAADTTPFNGVGDVTWTGDLAQFNLGTATWPVSPNEDFAGDRSLRTQNHPDGTVETIVTDVTSVVNLNDTMTWSVFFSGNSVTIQPSRRADFILLSDTGNVGDIEDPGTVNGVNAYKLTLWDPYSTASSNNPANSHDASGLGDTVALWVVDDTDDRWRLVGSVDATDALLQDGWNLEVQRSALGEWSIGFANGAIGTAVSLTSLGVNTVADFSGASSFFAGVGWTAPDTSGDNGDFGFDNFSVTGSGGPSVPEPAGLTLMGLATLMLARRRRV